MTDLAQEEGVFQESESVVIKNIIDFKKMVAKDIMTPRTVIKMAHEQTTIRQFYDRNPKLKFSRIPIYKDSPDDISGYFLKDQLFESIINGLGNQSLSTISREIYVAERMAPIKTLFENLIDRQEHIALVVDEYGSVSGIVTQEDIIETLLGLEIVDESDSHEDLQVLARKLWKIRAKRHGILDNDASEDQPSS